MELKNKTTKSINSAIQKRLIEERLCHGSIVDTIHKAQHVYIEVTGEQPTKIKMGWNQQTELRRELDRNWLVMMPFQGHTGMIAGLAVEFVKDENLMEME